VGADEDVELAGVQPADGRVVDGEMKNREEVAATLDLGVRIDLRALAAREHVLDVERMPAEAGREELHLLMRRRLEVDPGEAVAVELSEARLLKRDLCPGRRT